MEGLCHSSYLLGLTSHSHLDNIQKSGTRPGLSSMFSALTNVGARAQEGSVGPGSCCERVGCSVDGTSCSEEGGWMGELLPRGQGPIGPWKAGQEVIPKVKLVGITLYLFLVSQDHVSQAHVHGTPFPWLPQRWPEMVRDLCPLLGEPAWHWPQSWWRLRVRALGKGSEGIRQESWHQL